MANTPNANGVWRTIRGARVFIEDGVITKGPRSLRGKKETDVSSGSKWDDWKPESISWTKDRLGSPTSKFKTSSGRTFECQIYPMEEEFGRAGKDMVEFAFEDEMGHMELTGKGEAFEVMRKAAGHAISYVKKEGPVAMIFSSEEAEKSRTRLYRKLASNSKELVPGYTGVEIKGENYFGLVMDRYVGEVVSTLEDQFGTSVEVLNQCLDEDDALLTAEQLQPKHVRFI